MPHPPYDHPLNLMMQTIATYGLWALSITLLVIAIHRSLKERSWLPVLIILAVAFGSLLEPLYDIAYHLLWFIPGQWTLFTSFDLPQPVWVMAAYIVVFAGPTLFLYPKMKQGTTKADVFRLACTAVITTAVFEIAAINMGLYMYYGPHAMRLFEYPLWIAVMEASQITGFAVMVVFLSRRVVSQWAYLSLFAIFPANFAFAVLGAGFPGIIAVNMADPAPWLLWGGALLSMVFTAGSLWFTCLLLDLAPSPSHAATQAGKGAMKDLLAK